MPKELEVHRAPNPEPKKIAIETPNENSGAQGSCVEPAEGAQSASYGPGAMPAKWTNESKSQVTNPIQ